MRSAKEIADQIAEIGVTAHSHRSLYRADGDRVSYYLQSNEDDSEVFIDSAQFTNYEEAMEFLNSISRLIAAAIENLQK